MGKIRVGAVGGCVGSILNFLLWTFFGVKESITIEQAILLGAAWIGMAIAISRIEK